MFKHTPETKEKIRQSKIGDKNPMFGKHWRLTKEQCKQISDRQRGINNPMYGRKMSQEEKNKRRNYKHTPEAIEKIRLAGIGRKMSTLTKRRLFEANFGSKRTGESRKKMREAQIGKIIPKETRIKISLANRGRIVSEETRKKISISNMGKIMSEEAKIKIRIARKNQVFSEESRRKMGDSHRGDKSHTWKGGVTPINEKIRKSFEYKLWRQAVFKRDNYQCIFGGKEHGNKLHADHIRPFAKHPELRFDVNNGRTLCEKCHHLTDTWGCPKK